METLSLSPPEELERIASLFAGCPEPVTVRAAETGLVMVRGRIAGHGAAFNLGEVLASRCVVSVEGVLGFGYTLFPDERHAYLAALCDALGGHRDYAGPVERELAALRRRRAETVSRDEAEAVGTRVEFFTMVRGDD